MNDAAVLGGLDPLLGCNFKIAKPTLEQKCWMVQLVISKLETVASLAKRCSFSRKYLHKMVVRHLKGLPLRLKRGRPRVLDVISHEIIGASIQNNACYLWKLISWIFHHSRCFSTSNPAAAAAVRQPCVDFSNPKSIHYILLNPVSVHSLDTCE